LLKIEQKVLSSHKKTTMDLKSMLEQISAKRNYKLVEHRPGLYSLDVAIPLKDGKWRYQYVYVSLEVPQNGITRC
jgi:hypothetical protein